MKLSKFNSSISISEDYNLHYNSLNDSFLLSKKDYKISLDLDSKELNNLIETGFIVDDCVDEDEILRERAKSIITKDGSFRLILNPTLDCNFTCWYCYEEKCKGSQMDAKTLSSILMLIESLAKQFSSIHVSFFGGEPLISFKKVIIPIYECLEKVCTENDCNYSSSFTTNGGLISENILSYLQTKKVSNMQITIDGDKEHHNKTRFYNNKMGSYDIIMRNISKLIVKNISVTVRINYTPDNVHSIQKVAEDLVNLVNENHRSRLIVRLHQVWQTTNEDLSTIVEEVIEYLISNGIRALRPVLNNVYSPCYADYKNSALINYNGDVFKCTAVDFLNAKREGYLSENGEIIWENNNLDKRINSRFKNKACNECRIQPICNGGCSQKALHYGSESYCIFGFDESKKEKAIKERFIASLQAKKMKNTNQ